MQFRATGIAGVYVIEPQIIGDERGFFARTWCSREFAGQGLNTALVQCNVSFNRRRGTLRGMHYQRAPCEEAKLVRCTAGAIYDVVVDLRRDSASYLRWEAAELSGANRAMMYVPEGCAHGFVTLEDDTEVFYQMSQFHSAEHACGVRWNDPAFGIEWPCAPEVISPRDRDYPDFRP